MAFWRAYWITLRPYLFFVSGAGGLLGLAVAGDGMPVLAFAAALMAFLLSYGLGQAVTDVFQTDTDAISAPYRPLVRGELARGSVLAASLAGLGLCAATLFLLNPWTAPFAAATVVGLLTYTPLKRRFWAGPLWNSWIVALLPLLGLLCGVASPVEALADPRLAPGMASVFFSYAIFVLLGYLKDVEADRTTGYETLPVRFGRRATVATSAVMLVGAAVSSSVLLARSGALARPPSLEGLLGLGGWAGGLFMLLLAHVRALPTTRDDEAHPAVALSVRGFVALHLGEAALIRPDLAPLGAALYALFEAVLRRRPCVEQV